MTVVHVDFCRRTVVQRPVAALSQAVAVAPRQFECSKDDFDLESDAGALDLQRWVLARIEARFGDCQPKGGCLYLKPVSKGWIDTYGRGNFHNSVWQYKGRDWNRPQPFPSDLAPILKAFKRRKAFDVGLKSDPFQWLDCKYSITKAMLKAAQRHGVKLTLHTMSDLCAHEDYLELLKGQTVVINLGSNDDSGEFFNRQERRDSPGAPSITRRMQAVQKLQDAGIDVRLVTGDEHMALVRSVLKP